MNSTVILRVAVAIILLTHSMYAMFNNGINDFGNFYLNQIGFAPLGVPLAWTIKLSHVVCAVLLLLNKLVKLASVITIVILLVGIVLVHFKEGWFVVGGGRNGMEYNFLLICVLFVIMYPNGVKQTKVTS